MATKLIKSQSLRPLTLNESLDSTPNNKKYIFSGVFTACSVPGHVIINRNNRSYPEKTVLAHLGYLREMIKTSGSILGELDHPEGRFDVQLKEASHKITDLWYDQVNHNVMGKLEILDTPNGKIAQELVDSGYPLFVSSRAAGDVNEKTHEVEIAQIFTYDIVCTPSFAEAKLERVNESLVSDATMSYLNESVSTHKKEQENTKNKYKVLIEGVSVCELEKEAPINEKCMKLKNQPINLKDLSKPLLEEDEEFKLPEADVSAEGNMVEDTDDNETKTDDSKDNKDENKDNNKEDNKEDSKSDPTAEEKEEKRKLIISITAEEKGDEESSDEEEQEEKRSDIISIEGQEDDSEDDSENDTEDTFEKGKTDTENKEELNLKLDKIEKQTKKDVEKFKSILNNLEQKEAIKEKIVERYPFSISLSEDNFAKFAALTPAQKKKCMKYIIEHNIFKIKDINEQWDTPLNAERRVLKNWLRLADPEDIELYTKASLQEQDAIENMARYMILETKQDVDEFWEKTGLRTREAQRIMNEEFVKRYNVTQKPVMNKVQESTNPLGYSMDYIKLTEQLY